MQAYQASALCLSGTLLFVSAPTFSQQPPERELEACAQVRCYPAGAIPITLDDGGEASFDLKSAVPAVNDDVVAMLPGFSVFIAGDVVDGALTLLRAVSRPAELKDVLQIQMWQEPGKADTFLVVKNHFHDFVKYRAAMLVPKAERFRPTSVCAVLGDGRASYEHWPHAILQLVLLEFELVGANTEELKCE